MVCRADDEVRDAVAHFAHRKLNEIQLAPLLSRVLDAVRESGQHQAALTAGLKGLMRFLDEKLRALGTAACPPYHLAVVIGGTSAEYTLKVAKYASAHYLDTLPTSGNKLGDRKAHV